MHYIHFVKMQATGNDFVLLDARRLERDWPGLARSVCSRRFGVGADGLLLLLASGVADLKLRVFNADGSEAEACGNGLRCFARYALESEAVLAGRRELRAETMAGTRTIVVGAEGSLRVSMGRPQFAPAEVPVLVGDGGGGTAASAIKPILDYPISVGGRELSLAFVSMGNPHAVCFTDATVADFPLAELGPQVENHAIFPNRVNFEVAALLGGREVLARVWERGVGETLSCGSGACAVAVAAWLKGLVGGEVDVILPGGTLTVDWDGEGEVFLSGPAEMVFEGDWPERE